MGSSYTWQRSTKAKKTKKIIKMDNNSVWCVIPVYNNATTVKNIVEQSFKYIKNILVVDDGSTDANLTELLDDTEAIVIRHDKNKGKGAALLTAINYLKEKNVLSMITIDGDGQHRPEDLPNFLDAIENNPNSLYVGVRDLNQSSVPGSSRFGRKFSNMWFKIETGKDCKDTQSGFRAYPIKLISKLKLYGSFYDFEIEVIARAAWAQIPINEISINVVYDPPETRISHFNKFKDNFLISLMHTRLIGRCLVPLPHKKLVANNKSHGYSLVLNPIGFFKMLLNENTTPMALAFSAAMGTIIAVLPILGFHMIAIIYVTARLHLNKIMALGIQILYSPPFVPFVCIEVGHYFRNGNWLSEFTLAAFKTNWQEYIFDWFIGSLVMAPIYAIIAFVAVYFIALKIQKKISKHDYA
ncbi:hypothetical protein SAMN04487931_108195 [Desulfobacula phenolica]|nr:hypothetical protein SAMN04487931_108195 [Desulfobacula phenolica]